MIELLGEAYFGILPVSQGAVVSLTPIFAMRQRWCEYRTQFSCQSWHRSDLRGDIKLILKLNQHWILRKRKKHLIAKYQIAGLSPNFLGLIASRRLSLSLFPGSLAVAVVCRTPLSPL